MNIPGWETRQTVMGNVVLHARNMTGNVDDVEIKNWTVHVADDKPRTFRQWGFTLGPYINTQNVETDEPMYRHELVHTIQSRFLGPLYLPVVGAPSLASAAFSSDRAHAQRWYEVQGTRWGGAPHNPPHYNRNYKKDSFGYWLGALSPYLLYPLLFF